MIYDVIHLRICAIENVNVESNALAESAKVNGKEFIILTGHLLIQRTRVQRAPIKLYRIHCHKRCNKLSWNDSMEIKMNDREH